MIKKMYSNYEINKKYAIRKLSIGAFSIAIGLFASNMNELPVIGTHLGPSIVQAAEPEVTNWQPEGNIIARGEYSVPWELYENGYLLFKPTTDKNTLRGGNWVDTWLEHSSKIKAIGSTGEIFLPSDSSRLFSTEGDRNQSLLSGIEYIDGSKLNTSKVVNMEKMFYGLRNLKEIDVSNWDTSNVTNMSYMFGSGDDYYYTNSTNYLGLIDNLDVSNWDTSKVINMSGVFLGQKNLTNLNVENWNTSNVKSMSNMFHGAKGLTDLNLSKWDTSNVINMSNMFSNTDNLRNLNVNNWDTSNVTNMYGMFEGTRSLTNLDLNNWNTGKVVNMSKMFSSNGLETLDLNNWNTSNVTNMAEMFYNSGSKTLNINNWDTSKVTDMSGMFRYTKMENLDLNNWNTSNVRNMSAMFMENDNLNTLNISNWDTGNVENMSDMFIRDYKLTSLDLSNWNTSKVTNMGEMFWESGLVNLNLSNWDTSKVESMSRIFVGVGELENLDISNWDTKNVTDLDTIFQANSYLKKIKFGSHFYGNQSNSSPFTAIQPYGKYEADDYGTYTKRWVKEDGSAGPYTVNEWWEAYKANPEMLAGTWVREKKPVLTVNFNTGSNETINPLSVNGNSTDELPVPTEDKPGYKFLGWSKTEDGDIIKNKSEIGQPGETVTLYAKWEKVDNVRKENTPIEMTTVYEGDEELETGTNKEISGVPGEKEIITTYEVTPITGELINPSTTENIITSMTPKTIKIGTKPKVVYSKQGDNVVKTTTRYTVNSNNGDVTENVTEEIVGRGTVADKVVEKRLHYGVEYERNDEVSAGTPNVIRQTGVDGKKTIRTSYNVDPETGNITANEPVETIENPTSQIEVVGTKSEEIVTEQKFKKTYISDENKEKGLTEVSEPGVNGKTIITRTYNLPENIPVREEQDEINGVKIVFNYEFNTAIPNDSQPSITQPTNEIIKVGTKPKVVYSKKGDNVIKTTTRYTVNPNNGDITEDVTEEIVGRGTVADKVVEKRLHYGVEYERNDEVSAGTPNVIKQSGVDGKKITRTSYTVDPETGNITANEPVETIENPTPQIEVVGTKSEEIVTEQEFKKTYIGDETKEKGLTEISVPGVNGKTVITRTYNLPENVPVREEQDEINGVRIVFNYEFNTAIPNDSEPSITHPTNEIVKVGTRPKVVYSKDGDDIVKSTTVYTVDPNNGTISENTTKETFNKNGVKTKVEITSIPSPNKYVKDDTREKSADNIIEQGTPGSKTVTTTYDVNPEDGSKIENVGNPVIVNPTDTIIKVAAKNKVEIVKEKGQIIERTTNYTVNEKTGEISETVTDKLISSSTPLIPNVNGSDLPDEPELNTNEKPEYKESVSTNTTTDEKGNEILPPVVEELPEYNGGANPTDSPVNEKPEYTEELSTNTPIDENENPILPPVVDELPEFTGGVNPSDAPIHEIPEYTDSLSTNTPIDDNGELVLPPVVEKLPEYNGNINHTEIPVNEVPENIVPLNNSTVNNTEKSETAKEEAKKERELPDTNSSSVIVGLVSSVIGTLGLGYKSRGRK